MTTGTGGAHVRSRNGLASRLTFAATLATVAALVSAAAVAGGEAQAAAQPGASGARGGRATVAGVISTVVGGVGGPARATRVAIPAVCGVAFSHGSLYASATSTMGGIANSGGTFAVRKVSMPTGRLTTPAGTGAVGPPGDGGPAVKASVGGCGLAFDHHAIW